MGSILQKLQKNKILKVSPSFVPESIQYEVIYGSVAFGVSNDNSDMDIYGFCIPPKDYIFPHLRGEIPGFSIPGPSFDQFQQHHIIDPSADTGKGREYDFAIYSITKYFRLCLDNNPNMIDSLFVPRRCIVHTTAIGEMVREQRKLFLHKGSWAKFKGYAYAQVHKMGIKQPQGKRKKMVEEFGYDVKYAYHVVRLLNEIEQILVEQDLDLERNREQLKAIRRGEWTQQQVVDYFEKKEQELESVYSASQLTATPNYEAVHELLLNCLEHYYGSLDTCIVQQDEATKALKDIEAIISRVKSGL